MSGLYAGWMLDAVEQWALPHYWMIRETAIAAPVKDEGLGARLRRFDGLLVPVSLEASVQKQRGYWTAKMGLVGIEIKASRADFLAGLRRGQFKDYESAGVIGLFVVTGRDVKSAEVPRPHGHLVCFHDAKPNHGPWPDTVGHAPSIVCRRLPKWAPCELDQDSMWRIVFWCGERTRELERQEHQRQLRMDEKIGRGFASALRRMSAGDE